MPVPAALIFVDPAVFPVTRPVASTLAMAVASDENVKVGQIVSISPSA